MSKSKFKGTCQCCESIQCLPKGLLAKHGYQVAGFGFFNGICPGAGHQPLEESCALVEHFAKMAENQVKTLTNRITEVQAYPPFKGHYHLYHRASYDECGRRRQSYYSWELVEDYRTYPHFSQGSEESRQQDSPGYLALCVKSNNDRFIADLENEIQRLRRFVDRKQEIITNWAPAPLKAAGPPLKEMELA